MKKKIALCLRGLNNYFLESYDNMVILCFILFQLK